MNHTVTPPPAHEREPTTHCPSPEIEIDFAYFQRYLTDYDLSPDQQRELIATIASIVCGFIDLGFGIAPGQIVLQELTENTDDSKVFPPALPDHVLHSPPEIPDKFDPNAAHLITAERSDS